MPKIAIAFAMFATACAGMVPGARADDRVLSYVSFNAGKAFESVITAEALGRTPSWNDSNPNPPLSARDAMRLADQLKGKLVQDTEDGRWGRVAMELRLATADHWYWLARYELEADGTGPTPDLIILVLMDGTVITPQVYPKRKYMTQVSGPLNESGYYFLQGTTLTDAELAHLQGMHSLDSITLNSAEVTDNGLERIGRLVQLKALCVTSPKVGDPGLEHLRGLSKLEHLILQSPQITDAGLRHLSGLSDLQYLYLEDCAVTGRGCEYLTGLKNLQDLTITYARIQGVGLGYLKDLSQLKSLDLEGNPLDDAGMVYLRGLVQLQVLNLTGTQVSDTGMEHLTQLNQLARLYLRDTAVTEDGVKMLRKALPDCDVVR